ncbi:MAG: hypothetical protein PHV02_17015 [Rhodocyclaceae bacterium]|nr:hypothetical protein [Rhodocyclaceae bacterium]
MSHKNRKFVRPLAWIQIVFSVLLGATVVWGYVGYQASLGQFTRSLAAAIVSTANVLSETGEAMQAKENMLDNSLGIIVSSRELIDALKASAQNQSTLVPKYTEGIQGASGILGRAGSLFFMFGDNLKFSVPTDVVMKGFLPDFVWTKPLEKTALEIQANAQQLTSLSTSLREVSSSLEKDGQNVSAAFINTSNHALKVLDDAEKALAVMKGKELPKTIAELKVASDNLRIVSTQVNIAGNISLTLLIAGLLLAGWCLLNSISILLLTAE